MEFNTVLFLLLVALGAFIQTVSGFAMGLIIIAGATLLGLAEIAFSAAVIGIISLVNSTVALRTSYRHIDPGYLKWTLLTLIPALLVGVWLLEFLSEAHYEVLRVMLGLVVICGGIMLMFKPTLYGQRSRRLTTTIFGALGGIIGGLYSAGGAALAYHLYRQPVAVSVVRATLLSFFVVSTLIRTVMISVAGQVDAEVLVTSFAAIPLVVLVTEGTSRLLPYIPDGIVRRLVFVMMTFLGALLLID
ncbi:MAG: sulfite exporter TauE/SafE family protein [Proteobacteria bacterium]|nr:sulfite exporter TauE/SafE family protein [Pseudomonadota bacterium]MDA1301871.1 sulfite exporter TauE/SafE family protein [Pseudomonadota bacterium]